MFREESLKENTTQELINRMIHLYESDETYSFSSFFTELEKTLTYKKDIKEITENDIFFVPEKKSDTGYLFSISENGLLMNRRKNGVDKPVITKECRAEELAKILYTCDCIRPDIGYAYPDGMGKLVESIQTGDMISFSKGDSIATYICTKVRHDATIDLLRLYDGKLQNATVTKFAEQLEKPLNEHDTLFVNPKYDRWMQEFYDQVKTITGSVLPSIHKMDNKFAETVMFEQEKRANNPFKRYTTQIGSSVLELRKKLSGEVEWRCNNVKLPRESVKAFISWVYHAPLQVEMDKSLQMDKFEQFCAEYDLQTRIDNAVNEDNGDTLTRYLIEFCSSYPVGFQVNISSYNDKGQGTSFIFKNEENYVKIYKVSYIDNSFEKGILNKERVSADVFRNFCNAKVQAIESAILGRAYDLVSQKINYETTPLNSDEIERITNTVAKEIEKTESTAAFTYEDITPLSEAMDSLIRKNMDDSVKISEVLNQYYETPDLDR